MLEYGDENDDTNASKVQLQPPYFYSELIKFLFSFLFFIFFFLRGGATLPTNPSSLTCSFARSHTLTWVSEVFLQLSGGHSPSLVGKVKQKFGVYRLIS